MLSFFKSNSKKKVVYTKKNILEDISLFNKIFSQQIIKYNSKDIIDSIIKKTEELSFIIININDKHQYDDEEEKALKDGIEFKKIKIYNVEDYIKVLIEKINLNSNSIKEEYNNIILLLQQTYFFYLGYKRKKILELEKEYEIDYPYFDQLYKRPFLNNLASLKNEKLNLGELTKIKERNEELGNDYNVEISNYLNEILLSNIDKNDDIPLRYISSFVYFIERHLDYINNTYIIKKNTEIENLLTVDNLIINKFYPAVEFEKKQVEITKIDGKKELIICKKSLIFTTFDSIINRFTDSKKVFKGFLDSYYHQDIVLDFKIFSSKDFIEITKEIEKVYKFLTNFHTKELNEININKTLIGKGEAKKNFDNILIHAIKNKVSDIYIKRLEEYGLVVMRNSRGVLEEYQKLHLAKLDEMINVILEDASINRTIDQFKPKGGKNIVTITDNVENKQYQDYLRMEYVGGNLYIRRLNKEAKNLNLEELGYNRNDLFTINNWCETNSNGLILVCGPTGSGKTTLLNTILMNQLSKRPDIHLLTAEDPVEKRMNLFNIEQFEVNKEITYKDYLKSFLRDDPDWIMIGETRDSEVLSTLVDASETGHLTFTTLHTNNTISSLDRIIKLYTNGNLQLYEFARDVILQNIRGIVNVKLLKRLCNCKEEISHEEVLKKIINKGYSKEIAEKYIHKSKSNKFYTKSKGCHHCNNTGYSGEIQGIMEIMDLNNKETFKKVQEGDYSDIISLFDKGYEYVLEGIIDIDELIKKT